MKYFYIVIIVLFLALILGFGIYITNYGEDSLQDIFAPINNTIAPVDYTPYEGKG